MSITFGTDAAAAILEFDRIARLLEEEAAGNKKDGWVEPGVEEMPDDLPPNTTQTQRGRVLARLVELGYWRRESLDCDGYPTNEGEPYIYYYPIKWLFHENGEVQP